MITNSYRYVAEGGDGSLPDYNWILHLDANLDVYEADGITRTPHNSYTTQYWRDQSVSGNDASQLSSSAQVRYLHFSSNFNFENRPAFDWSPGGTRYFDLTNPISMANDYTFIAVIHRYNDGVTSAPLGGSTTARNYPLYWQGSNQNIYIASQDGAAYGYAGLSGASAGKHMVVTQSSNSGAGALIWRNGTVLGDENTLDYYTPTSVGNVEFVGKRYNQLEGAMIAEIIMTNQVLTLQQIQNVETYLYPKWGFTY